MAETFLEIAERMGGRILGTLPAVGGEAFGMARLGKILHDQLTPKPQSTPSQAIEETHMEELRVEQPKVPMSIATRQGLEEMARKVSTPERAVGAMEIAAQLLEEAVAREMVNEGQQVQAKAHTVVSEEAAPTPGLPITH